MMGMSLSGKQTKKIDLESEELRMGMLFQWYVIKNKNKGKYLSAIVDDGVCWRDSNDDCMRFLYLDQARIMLDYIKRFMNVDEELKIARKSEKEEEL